MRAAREELVKKDKEMLRGEQNFVEFCPLTPDLDEIGVGVKYTKKERGGNNVKHGDPYDGLKQMKMSRE